MYVLNAARNRAKKISVSTLNDLRMLMDWQVKQLGYCPDSVTDACRKLDEFLETQQNPLL